MDLLVSCQETGGVRVIRVSKNGTTINLKFKTEFCSSGSENYAQRILTFQFGNRKCLAVGRKTGLVQLYEKCKGKQGSYYQIVKEWKNSNMNDQDEIVKLGFLSNQYLYSCSSDGKLVIRDLINDDANESYKVYLVHNPVSDIELKIPVHNQNRVMIACAGKNSELKLYEIDLEIDQTDLTISRGGGTIGDHEFPVIQNSNLRSTIDLNYSSHIIRPIRRSYTNLNLRPFILPPSSSGVGSGSYTDRQVNALSPIWTSNTAYEKYLYNPNPSESISNWIVSVCILDEYVVCGTQFGKLLIYDIFDDSYPAHSIQVSQFPIKNLFKFVFSQYLIYSDSISKIGIINLSTLEVTNFYEDLDLGPLAFFKLILPDSMDKKRKFRKLNSNVLKFDPIYVISTRVDKKLVIYKLYDDNSFEKLLDVGLLSTFVPSLSILNDNEYETLHRLFGRKTENYASDEESIEESTEVLKKRRIMYSKDLLARSSKGLRVPYKHDTNDTNEVDEAKVNGKDGLNDSVKSMSIS